MLVASYEGLHFLSWAIEDFTQVRQQSYTPKEFEDSRKLGSNKDNVWDTQESVQGACTENFNPQVINRNRITRRKMENRLISAFPAVLGLSVKTILLQGRLLPALTQQRAQLTLWFQHLLPSLQGPAVFILRSQHLYDDQLTGSGCDFLFFYFIF